MSRPFVVEREKMESFQLEVTDRTDEEKGTSSARRLRRDGMVPLNLYGLDREPRGLKANALKFDRVIESGSHVVELVQSDKTQVVLMRDVQYDSLGSTILHADLIRIDREKAVHVFVPIRYIGQAPEVAGSHIEKILEDVQVECLPLEIPEKFVINLSKVGVGEQVTVGDLEMGPGCKPYDHNDDDTIVVNSMKAQKVEEEPVEGEENAEPEVIGKEPEE